ncbi:MAG: prepilin-type N-terminal cleavage/methylation domain-containing protein [Rhodocyclaceae bacterium]|nr:prepilin-type N-terminal cleavage/methylation domain-containing protein [Rhodocyclaceae bacterium]
MRSYLFMQPRGFTLLEMLVVLALIGVMAGIALPNFSRFLESFSVRNQWAGVERELADLPYQVFVSGSPFQLDSGSAEKRLTTLPEGWRVEVANPILYRFSGWCEGGRLTVVSAGGERRNYQLAAPTCRPTVTTG